MIVTHKGKTIGLATSQEMADRIIHEYLEELKGEKMFKHEIYVDSELQLEFLDKKLNIKRIEDTFDKDIFKLDKSVIGNNIYKRYYSKIKEPKQIEDLVNSPNHYTKYKKIKGEVIDLIEEVTSYYPKEVVYHIGNALKYLLRAPFKKNMIQDLEKAIYHLKRAVEILKKDA